MDTPLNAPAILAEHDAHEARAIAEITGEPTRPFHEHVALLRKLDECPRCGKSTALLNVAKQRGFHTPYRAEAVNPAVHCACPGGPAYVSPAVDAAGTAFAPSVCVEAISRLYASAGNRWIDVGTPGYIVTIDTARRIAAVQFDGMPDLYLITVTDLRNRVKVTMVGGGTAA